MLCDDGVMVESFHQNDRRSVVVVAIMRCCDCCDDDVTVESVVEGVVFTSQYSSIIRTYFGFLLLQP